MPTVGGELYRVSRVVLLRLLYCVVDMMFGFLTYYGDVRYDSFRYLLAQYVPGA